MLNKNQTGVDNTTPSEKNVAPFSNTPSIITVTVSKKTRNPFLDTLSKARNVYKKQINRDAQTKKAAIGHILKLSDKDSNMDDLVFLANFYDIVYNRLLDSNRFLKDCADLGLNSFNIAQHVAFDGNKKLDEVLTVGIKQAYGNELVKMKEPIYTETELNAAKVLSKQESGTETPQSMDGSSTNSGKAA